MRDAARATFSARVWGTRMITAAIGDIHGMQELLARLLREIAAYTENQNWSEYPRLVFLGDYVDRGPASREVVRLLRQRQETGAVCLRGNHEEMMARCRSGPFAMSQFLANGGVATLASYADHPDDFDEDRRWMAALPTSYEDDLRIFVHAGLMPRRPLDAQDDETKLWIRDKFLNFDGAFPKYVVHGHTPVQYAGLEGVPEIRANRCDLDTGACYGGTLSVAFFDERQAAPFHTISVR
jgi:serine/threonine protein phosphatase 1